MAKVKVFLTVLCALTALFVGIALCLPAHWRVERSIVVSAVPEHIFPYLNDMRLWPMWTHIEETDPTTQRELSGPIQGVGARQTWNGQKIGRSSLVVTASEVNRGIRYDFSLRDAYLAHGDIRLLRSPAGTQVTWTAEGDLGLSPASRFFGLMFNASMGGDFERSLRSLKIVAERAQALAGDPTLVPP